MVFTPKPVLREVLNLHFIEILQPKQYKYLGDLTDIAVEAIRAVRQGNCDRNFTLPTQESITASQFCDEFNLGSFVEAFDTYQHRRPGVVPLLTLAPAIAGITYLLSFWIAPLLIPSITIIGWPIKLVLTLILTVIATSLSALSIQFVLPYTLKNLDLDVFNRSTGNPLLMVLMTPVLWLGLLSQVIGWFVAAGVLWVSSSLSAQIDIPSLGSLVQLIGLILLVTQFIKGSLTSASVWLIQSWWRGLVYPVVQIGLLALVPMGVWIIGQWFPGIIATMTFPTVLLGTLTVYLLRAPILACHLKVQGWAEQTIIPERFQVMVVLTWLPFLGLLVFPGICLLAGQWVNGFSVAGYGAAIRMATLIWLVGMPEFQWSKSIRMENLTALPRQ